MAGAEAKKLTIEEDPGIVAGALEGLAEYKAGLGKKFNSVEDLKAYLEKS
ncbi:MAG: hypothetical protein A4E48_01755 [Methanosaeta sp. PtaU1.Bin060]|jgi:hypothetical protein|nr:MAG: hypothetical protein A4E48_01755 [Methanosaeta sp. PtaU1.Bin060]